MAKQKKRVSVAQHQRDGRVPVEAPAVPADDAAPEQTTSAAEIPAALSGGGESDDSAESVDSSSADTVTRAGVESQPLFWFAMGALAVGIIVLLGLLIMTPAAPSRAAPLAAPAATRAAPATVIAAATRAPQATQVDVAPTLTAMAISNKNVPRVTIEETKAKLDAGTVLVVDVRTREAYSEQHIKGAINIPEPDTEARLSEFPKDKEIVLYCS